MSMYSKSIEATTKVCIAAGVIAETEKVFLRGNVRAEVQGTIAAWPFEYTSDLAIATPGGIVAGYLGLKAANYVQRFYSDEGTIPVKKPSKFMAALAAAAIAVVPVKIGYEFEMADKCDMMTAQQREILACEPDPIDAGSIILGAALGIAYTLRNREEDIPVSTASALGTDQYSSQAL